MLSKTIRSLFALLIMAMIATQPLFAQQDDPNNFKEQFMGHFDYASRVLQLAEEMPADNYDWRPMEGVDSVQEVYLHIAQSNFAYLVNNLGMPAPEGVQIDQISSISGKENVVSILEQSVNYVKEHVQEMPSSKINAETKLYGRTTNGQGVLLQLLSHLSEHVGQSIAYARMNEVVPPWNQ